MLADFFVAALPLCIGVWLTQAAVDDARRKAGVTENDIKDYIRFRDYLQQFLTLLGILLSVFTLTSAALRCAVLASGATIESRYPPIYLLVFGACYTMSIVVVYFPAYRSVVSFEQKLLDIYCALPSPSSDNWGEAYSRHKKLEELLELKLMGTQRFITSITVLEPFVSSVFALLIGNNRHVETAQHGIPPIAAAVHPVVNSARRQQRKIARKMKGNKMDSSSLGFLHGAVVFKRAGSLLLEAGRHYNRW